MKSEWQHKKLGEIGQVVGGATPSTRKAENYQGGLIPWITPKDLSNHHGRYISHGERNITESGLKSCAAKMMPTNSILFSSRAPIGYIAIASNPVCTNQGFKSIVPNEDIFPLFLYYLLVHNREKIKALGSGTTFMEVSASTMSGVEVDIPSLATQRKIAAILSALDDKIENNNAICKNLEEQAGTLLLSYQYREKRTIELGEVMNLENGHPFKSNSYVNDGQYKIITIKNVLDGRVDACGASCVNEVPHGMKEHCKLHEGDVLLSLTGNVGRVGIVAVQNALLNQRVAKLAPKHTDELPYFYFLFRAPMFKQQLVQLARGTAQANLSPIETLKLSIRYSEETRNLSIKLSPMFHLLLNNQRENLMLGTLRDSLLPKLMSGEIDVDKVAI